jgi:phosphoribosylamine--glycine ligase
MKVLVIGGGGREHALIWKIKQSELVDKIYCSPGNGGIQELAELVDILPADIEGLLKFAIDKKIDLTVVGPEVPLVKGIVDEFERNGLRIFGPTQESAKLEGSKAFAKGFMKEFNIPTAEFEIFDNYEHALDYLTTLSYPKVIKADGLCGGKGSIIADNLEQAREALNKIMKEKIFGPAGDKIIIEEFLEGDEASIIAISDGENLLALASSQDHKQIFDNDKGPNTGGMGAYSPAPVAEGENFNNCIEKILKPTINGMREKGIPFKGVLYAGIMFSNNIPYVLEFNVRFGDPETQAILPRLKSDLVKAIEYALDGRLNEFNLEWDEKKCICVVIASGGYPKEYEKGKLITGLEKLNKLEDVLLFHAGTKAIVENGKKNFYTNGGRVLNIVALDNDFKESQEKVYNAIKFISFENMHYRKDIGNKAYKWLKVI